MNWDLPYESRRDPVFARNVVATSQPLATASGISAMRQGGNAIDAALAAAITLTVVEPCSNGVGSDAFAIVWNGSKLHGLNASGCSPARWNLDRFKEHSQMPTEGWDTVTVPGAVSAWTALSQRFGRLPFAKLFEDAIAYADEGFQVGRRTSNLWRASIARFRNYENFQQHFVPHGRAPNPGELFKSSALASTLTRIAETKGDAFYRGDLAEKIVDQSQAEGGLLQRDDLENHEVIWCEPIAQRYASVDVHEMPPNGQGLATLIALALLDRLQSREHEPNSTIWTHLQVEAMKVAIRAAFEHFADPRSMDISIEELLNTQTLDKLAKTISPSSASPVPKSIPRGSDTVYLATADKDGNMVSYIQSNYMGFGSGIVIKGTGIALQNRGAGFSLTPGHPNVVAGSKRPFHTIIPGFVTQAGKPQLAFGVMGGHMQHQGHVQMVTRIFDHDQNPQAASDAPRWYVSPDYKVVLEKGFPKSTVSELSDLGHDIQVATNVNVGGGAQLIARLDDGYCGASDHRKEGLAAGF